MIEDTSEFAGVVYGLHLGDYKFRYIGKTQQTLLARVRGHLKSAKAGEKTPLYDWIRKHGAENIQVCAIETFSAEDIDQIDEREIFHIAQARDFYFEKNLNLAEGGGGAAGVKRSIESRQKQSLTWANKPKAVKVSVLSDQHRANLSAAFKGVPRPEHVAASLRVNSSKGQHVRWHTNRGIVKPDCSLCGSAS